ncbi:MAG: ACP S-malonyltransferase [Rhizobiales bacterium]|nr:ACP S-malonyltransferase [Hyphomicrobiales bacterium]
MTLAMTFPGQGSQSIGMGKALAESFPEAKAVFDEVNEALGQDLSAIMFEGDQDTLTLTANAQPALMAVSVAVVKVLESKGYSIAENVSFVAGHSLGEYSALCASGAISITDTAKLLRIRGNAMQAAVPVGKGAMAAIIGLEQSQVEEICASSKADGVCQIANDNGGGQLVISGSKAEVELAAEKAKEAGAKRALILPVSAPFHSALMGPAAEAMQEALANVQIESPVVPLIVNVLAAPISDGEEIKKRLVEQVTGQVRWRETIEWLGQNGVTNLIEAGSGKVLSGLARRINRDLKSTVIGTPDDITSFLAPSAQ